MTKDIHCPTYPALLGHFARVVIQRDAMQAQLAALKADQPTDQTELHRLLVMLGKALFDDREKLIGSNLDLGARNDLIWRRIVGIRKNAGERVTIRETDSFEPEDLESRTAPTGRTERSR